MCTSNVLSRSLLATSMYKHMYKHILSKNTAFKGVQLLYINQLTINLENMIYKKTHAVFVCLFLLVLTYLIAQ